MELKHIGQRINPTAVRLGVKRGSMLGTSEFIFPAHTGEIAQHILVVSTTCQLVKVKVKKRIAVSGIPSHSYGTSLAIWDHTVLPATRHK